MSHWHDWGQLLTSSCNWSLETAPSSLSEPGSNRNKHQTGSCHGRKPIPPLIQASPRSCLALWRPTSMLHHATGSSVRPASSFGTSYGDLLGREHPARDPNASSHLLSFPGEECDSCCPRSPVLLPRWDRLQHQGKWWRDKTMASGTCPWGRGTQLLPTRVCRDAGRRGRDGAVPSSPALGASSHLALPSAHFASSSLFPLCVEGM